MTRHMAHAQALRKAAAGAHGLIFTAYSDGRLRLRDREVACALGRGGVIAAADKREGDGATPLGLWRLRRVLYRADWVGVPVTALESKPIRKDDGWCDAPYDRAYNRQVALPYPASCERLWREDRLYDLVCVLGHNDDPPVPKLGSAIFLHVARPDYAPTEGCIALARQDLQSLLALAGAGDLLQVVEVTAPAQASEEEEASEPHPPSNPDP